MNVSDDDHEVCVCTVFGTSIQCDVAMSESVVSSDMHDEGNK